MHVTEDYNGMFGIKNVVRQSLYFVYRVIQKKTVTLWSKGKIRLLRMLWVYTISNTLKFIYIAKVESKMLTIENVAYSVYHSFTGT